MYVCIYVYIYTYIHTYTTWRRKWQPTTVILPGEFHGQRSLAGYNSWGCKESGVTEQLSLTYTHMLAGGE